MLKIKWTYIIAKKKHNQYIEQKKDRTSKICAEFRANYE